MAAPACDSCHHHPTDGAVDIRPCVDSDSDRTRSRCRASARKPVTQCPTGLSPESCVHTLIMIAAHAILARNLKRAVSRPTYFRLPLSPPNLFSVLPAHFKFPSSGSAHELECPRLTLSWVVWQCQACAQVFSFEAQGQCPGRPY
eukprot:2511693-Rhodomonas_salina.1